MHLQVDPGQFPNLQKKPQNGDQYVILVAESRDLFEKKLMLNILLSSRKGYIFIQTDKTIYNPGEHGKKSELLDENSHLYNSPLY